MSKDAISVSTIGTTVTTGGCHVLRIKGYSQTKLLGAGASARSCLFEAAGQWWRIFYYPNGYLGQNNDLISLALELAHNEHTGAHNEHTGQPEPDHVNAVARFTLVPRLPHHGRQQPAALPHSVKSSGRFRLNWGECFQFINKEELEMSEGYLVDDCFAVRCDIDVVNTWAARDRVRDVVETTAGMGLVWRSRASCEVDDEGLHERRRASGWVAMEDGGGSTATQQAASAWPLAGVGQLLHRLFIG